jgi:hypothetical protein
VRFITIFLQTLHSRLKLKIPAPVISRKTPSNPAVNLFLVLKEEVIEQKNPQPLSRGFKFFYSVGGGFSLSSPGKWHKRIMVFYSVFYRF